MDAAAGTFEYQGEAHGDGHEQQRAAHIRIYAPDDLIYRDQGGEYVVCEYYNDPEQFAHGRHAVQQVGGPCDKRTTHADEHDGDEDVHYFLDVLAQVDAYQRRGAAAAGAYGYHAGEVVVHSAHEDAAQHDPDVGYRAVCSAQYCAENGAEAGDVQKLDDEDPPGFQLLIINSVGTIAGGCDTVGIGFEKPCLYELAVEEKSRNQ